MYDLITVSDDNKSRFCSLYPKESSAIKCGNNDNNRPNTSNLEYHLLKYHRDTATEVKLKHKEHVERAAEMKEKHLGSVNHRQAKL